MCEPKLLYGDVWAPDPACYLTDQEIETREVGRPVAAATVGNPLANVMCRTRPDLPD